MTVYTHNIFITEWNCLLFTDTKHDRIAASPEFLQMTINFKSSGKLSCHGDHKNNRSGELLCFQIFYCSKKTLQLWLISLSLTFYFFLRENNVVSFF